MSRQAFGYFSSTFCTTAAPSSLGMRRSSTITSGLCCLVQLQRLGAVTGFGHHLHVGLLIDDGRESVAHHGMIVGEDHADLASRHFDRGVHSCRVAHARRADAAG